MLMLSLRDRYLLGSSLAAEKLLIADGRLLIVADARKTVNWRFLQLD
jgi:hypothetical protein